MLGYEISYLLLICGAVIPIMSSACKSIYLSTYTKGSTYAIRQYLTQDYVDKQVLTLIKVGCGTEFACVAISDKSESVKDIQGSRSGRTYNTFASLYERIDLVLSKDNAGRAGCCTR